jgi:hypothetical protein
MKVKTESSQGENSQLMDDVKFDVGNTLIDYSQCVSRGI